MSRSEWLIRREVNRAALIDLPTPDSPSNRPLDPMEGAQS